MTKAKVEEARNSFGRFYSKDPQSEEISTQILEVQSAIDHERALLATTSWTQIFGRRTIRRTLVAVAIPVGASLSGAFVIFTYAAIFLTGLGIKSPDLINVYINVCVLAGSCIGPFAVEFLSRRRSILTGYSGMATLILIFATVATGQGTHRHEVQQVLVAFLCLWAFMFGAFIASTMWITSAEMHPVHLRTYGQAFAISMNNIFQFASSFWTPYMISAKYGNWAPTSAISTLEQRLRRLSSCSSLCLKRARLTLEQIDDFFESGRKAWKTPLSENKQTAKRDTYASVF